MRKHLTEPAHTTTERENATKKAKGTVGDDTSKDQRHAQGENDRPGRWGWQLNRRAVLTRRIQMIARFHARLSLASDDINHCENYDPYPIYEVPVQRENLEAFGVLLTNMPGQRKEQHRDQGYQAYNNV